MFEIYALGAEVALGIHGERNARDEAGERAYLQSGILTAVSDFLSD